MMIPYKFHKLLERQLSCSLRDNKTLDELLQLISKTYEEMDKERNLIDRSIQLMSDELLKSNRELRHKSEQLAISEKRYALAADGANDGIWDYNFETKRFFYSERCLEILGMDKTDHLEANYERLVHPKYRKILKQAWNAHIKNQTDRLHVEILVRHKDGHYVWVLLKGKVSFSPQPSKSLPKKVSGSIAGSVSDISDKKNAEEKILERETYLKSVLNFTPNGIIVFSAHGNILSCNYMAEEIFGLSEDMMKMFKIGHLISNDPDRHKIKSMWHETLRTAKAFDFFEVEGIRLNKEVFPLEIIFSPIFLKSQKNFIGVFRDISKRREMEKNLESMHKNILGIAKKAGMSEVATSVLHNVGNVLNSVNVSANLLIERTLSSKISGLKKVYELMKEHQDDLGNFMSTDPRGTKIIEYLSKIVDYWNLEQEFILQETIELNKNICHVKDIISAQQIFNDVSGLLEPVMIHDILNEVLLLSLNKTATKNISIKIEKDYETIIKEFLTDRIKLQQILLNIIQNAKHALMAVDRSDRTIIVKTRIIKEFVTVSVTDNGCGIKSENLVKIFSYGFTTKTNGNGIGLHSSAIFAQEMGGSLDCLSDGLEKGATFILKIPYKLFASGGHE